VRCARRVPWAEFARRNAARNYLFKNRSHASIVLVNDRPVFHCRDFNQFMQIAAFDVPLVACSFHGGDQVADSLSGAATTRYSDFFHVDLDLGEEVLADSLVDIGFPREVAIDVRWRHMQLARNIRDRCLLEAESPEEPLRYFDN
jgi:hypothetical protein